MKKLITALFTLIALLGFAPARAANEVKLLEVASVFQQYYYGYVSSHFEVLVANLAYDKKVNVRAQLSNGSWTDIPLTFNRVANNNLEVWSTDVYDYGGSSRFGTTLQFAVSYTVNGQTYWDNNGGNNYVVPINVGYVLYNANVYAHPMSPSYYPYNNTYMGAVTVRNIAPAKDVKVVYTTDNWATTRTANANYSPNYWYNNYINLPNPTPYGFEEWSYSLDVGPTAGQLQFAISYTVNGQTYWDNNFGHNYSVTLIRY